jgi:hypothetical protein
MEVINLEGYVCGLVCGFIDGWMEINEKEIGAK